MAVTMTIYPSWKDKMGEAVNLATDTFKVILLNNSHSYNAAHDELADVTGNQLSTANGYTSGGATLASVTWTSDGTNNKFDADDVTWTASGGSITAYHAVVYDDTVSGVRPDHRFYVLGSLLEGPGITGGWDWSMGGGWISRHWRLSRLSLDERG